MRIPRPSTQQLRPSAKAPPSAGRPPRAVRRAPGLCGFGLAVLILGPARATTPWPSGATYRLWVDNVLDADRWRGLRPEAVERFDVRQRMQLDVYVLRPDNRGRGPRLTLAGDLEVAADLGPDGPALAVQPDGRRPALDLYQAAATLQTRAFDVRLGRTMWADALGFDALDGARAELRPLPHLSLHLGGGLAVRRARTDFGPDLFSPDGTRLPTAQARLWTAGLSLRDVPGLDLRADWRRHSDDTLQREEAALALRLALGPGAWIDAGGRADLVFLQAAELWADLGARLGPGRLEGGWRRARPTFSADSIWNAFGPTAWDELHLRGHLEGEDWRLAVDGAVRRFDLGDLSTQTPADPARGGTAARPADDQPGVDLGARLSRRVVIQGVAGDAGVQARLGTGYGGQRHLADVFGRLPVPLIPGNQPLFLRARMGALWVEDPTRPDRTGPSGWGLLGLDWRANEAVRLEALTEGHANAMTGPRLRLMTRVTFEDWW